MSPLPLPDRLFVWVPGHPVPQGSMKGYVRMGKAGVPVAAVTNSNPLLVAWRMKVTGHAIAAREKRDDALLFPITGPIGARIDFVMSRPQFHFGTGKNRDVLKPSAPAYPNQAPDIDKLLRAVFDALTDAQVWRDDGQVVFVQTTKSYVSPGRPEGVGITIGVMK